MNACAPRVTGRTMVPEDFSIHITGVYTIKHELETAQQLVNILRQKVPQDVVFREIWLNLEEAEMVSTRTIRAATRSTTSMFWYTGHATAPLPGAVYAMLDELPAGPNLEPSAIVGVLHFDSRQDPHETVTESRLRYIADRRGIPIFVCRIQPPQPNPQDV